MMMLDMTTQLAPMVWGIVALLAFSGLAIALRFRPGAVSKSSPARTAAGFAPAPLAAAA
jgi:hypothetical protein